jgi:hypothetical protein
MSQIDKLRDRELRRIVRDKEQACDERFSQWDW